MTNSFRLMR